jgi:hypothetical protein
MASKKYILFAEKHDNSFTFTGEKGENRHVRFSHWIAEVHDEKVQEELENTYSFKKGIIQVYDKQDLQQRQKLKA